MMKKWLCDACKFILGFVEDDTLRIKRKDLYVEVKGGKVTVTCCRCGKPSTLTDDSYKEVSEAQTQH
jgi:RNase P subunit RPR2